MSIESHHACDDGTRVTTWVSRVETTLILNGEWLNGERRIKLPATGPRTYSDGENHFWIESPGPIRISLAGRPTTICHDAPPPDPLPQ
jgi:hypothetical protein